MKYLICLSLLLLVSCSSSSPADPKPAATPRPAAPAAQTSLTISGRLLYVQDGQVWLHSGTAARPLDLGGAVRDPAWSHDGTRIAFVRRGESYADIYVVTVSTGAISRITFNDSKRAPRSRDYVHELYWAAQPTWSPNDRELVFLSQVAPATAEDDSRCPLCESALKPYRYDLSLAGKREPTNADLLAVPGGGDAASPRWSPDGTTLLYVDTPRGEGARTVMSWSFADETAEPVATIPAGAYDPAWSPDGRWIAFAAAESGKTDVWVVAATGGPVQRLTNLGGARAPAWSPDGTQLACINVGQGSTDVYILALQREGTTLRAAEARPATSGGHIDSSAGLSWSR